MEGETGMETGGGRERGREWRNMGDRDRLDGRIRG